MAPNYSHHSLLMGINFSTLSDAHSESDQLKARHTAAAVMKSDRRIILSLN